MESSDEQHLNALLEASRSAKAASVAGVWRRLAPDEQEAVLLRLLGMRVEAASETAESDGPPELVADDTAAIAAVEQTELIPKLGDDPAAMAPAEQTQSIPKFADDTKLAPAEQTQSIPKFADDTKLAPAEQTQSIPNLVEDLRGLSASHGDEQALLPEPLAVPNEYWSRWRRRWKISAVVSAWAVTTVFAFTADTSTFGPMEWVVAMFGTVVLGGTLVGTLINFAVVGIATRTHAAPGEQLTDAEATQVD